MLGPGCSDAFLIEKDLVSEGNWHFTYTRGFSPRDPTTVQAHGCCTSSNIDDEDADE